MTYFEFNERRTGARSIPLNVVEWPDITVTEGEIDDDTALEISLARSAAVEPA